MRRFFISTLFLSTLHLLGQNAEDEIKATIKDFITGINTADSTLMKSAIGDNLRIHVISKNPDGSDLFFESPAPDYITSMSSLPKNISFTVKLFDFNILIDNNMANVWIPIEFYVNELNTKLHHCGTYSFQLFDNNGKWKIIYWADKRRYECLN